MFEKVNPCHPDKVADRIAGAIVDIAYETQVDPKVAVEVLIGHGKCHIIAESSINFEKKDIKAIVRRIAGNVKVDFKQVPQDVHLFGNQLYGIRCGDNGIFKGMPLTDEQKNISLVAREIYDKYSLLGYREFTEYLRNKYPKHKIIICENGGIEKL